MNFMEMHNVLMIMLNRGLLEKRWTYVLIRKCKINSWHYRNKRAWPTQCDLQKKKIERVRDRIEDKSSSENYSKGVHRETVPKETAEN